MSAITLVWPDRAEKPTMGKHASPCLTQKAPYKGLCADFGEKHAPASDPDAVTVDSPKALDPNSGASAGLTKRMAPPGSRTAP